ncbi:MAG TPA: TetR/AcrR family transcriptional regulator [Candidatus Limnocylindria bacterium]
MPTPARTSRDEIVSAARTILEAEGPDGLTMQRVAIAVGVRAPSLYKHVRSRGELVHLVLEDAGAHLADEVGGAIGSGDHRRDLEALARAFRQFAHRHPSAYGLLFANLPDDWRPSQTTLAPATDALFATVVGLAGPDRALEGSRMVAAWAHGFITMELAGAFRLGGDVDDAFSYGIDRLASALRAA